MSAIQKRVQVCVWKKFVIDVQFKKKKNDFAISKYNVILFNNFFFLKTFKYFQFQN